ncbi:alpha/beta fold hydrolase [Raoultella terrigena]
MGTLGASAAWSVTPQSPIAWGERWKNLPPTPAPVAALKPAYASVNGIQLYYATTGEGTPVVLLHGGLANSDYWGQQVAALAKHHKVIVVDSRGHGRSTRDERPYSYDLMSDEAPYKTYSPALQHLPIQDDDGQHRAGKFLLRLYRHRMAGHPIPDGVLLTMRHLLQRVAGSSLSNHLQKLSGDVLHHPA